MTAAQAKLFERLIIGLCVLSILAIFQPFSLTLFSIGCVTVVIGALVFNLIPFCREGVPVKKLWNVLLIVLIVLAQRLHWVSGLLFYTLNTWRLCDE